MTRDKRWIKRDYRREMSKNYYERGLHSESLVKEILYRALGGYHAWRAERLENYASWVPVVLKAPKVRGE